MTSSHNEQWGAWFTEWRWPPKYAHLCFVYMMLCLLFIAVFFFRGKYRKSHNKMRGSIQRRARWPRSARLFVSFGIALVIECPCILLILCHLSATIMCAVENWPWLETFAYVASSAMGFGPPVALVPRTMMGKMFDICIAAVSFVLSCSVIAIIAGICVNISAEVKIAKPSVANLLFINLLFIAVMLVLCLLCSLIVALLEGADLGESFLWIAGIICALWDPLTSWVPTEEGTIFFASLCVLFELGLAGSFIGFLGVHPTVIQFINCMQGEMDDEQQEPTGDSEAPGDADASPGDNNLASKLAAALKSNEELGKRIEELEAQLRGFSIPSIQLDNVKIREVVVSWPVDI